MPVALLRFPTNARPADELHDKMSLSAIMGGWSFTRRYHVDRNWSENQQRWLGGETSCCLVCCFKLSWMSFHQADSDGRESSEERLSAHLCIWALRDPPRTTGVNSEWIRKPRFISVGWCSPWPIPVRRATFRWLVKRAKSKAIGDVSIHLPLRDIKQIGNGKWRLSMFAPGSIIWPEMPITPSLWRDFGELSSPKQSSVNRVRNDDKTKKSLGSRVWHRSAVRKRSLTHISVICSYIAWKIGDHIKSMILDKFWNFERDFSLRQIFPTAA
jgi:hypothetical protein